MLEKFALDTHLNFSWSPFWHIWPFTPPRLSADSYQHQKSASKLLDLRIFIFANFTIICERLAMSHVLPMPGANDLWLSMRHKATTHSPVSHIDEWTAVLIKCNRGSCGIWPLNRYQNKNKSTSKQTIKIQISQHQKYYLANSRKK